MELEKNKENLITPKTPENQRDEEVKRDKIETFYSPEDKGMISRWRTFSGFGENAGTSLYELCVALTLVIDAQDTERQSWEREKKGLEADRDKLRSDHYEYEKIIIEKEKELTCLKSRNEELEAENADLLKRIINLSTQAQSAKDNLKSYQNQLAISKRLSDECSRLTASLSAAHEALEDIASKTKESVDVESRTVYEWPTKEARIAQKALSDPSGKLALERWRRMDAVIKSVRRHLENGTVVTEERMAGCLSELEALDASEGGSDV